MTEQLLQDFMKTDAEASPLSASTKFNDLLPTLMIWSVVVLVIVVLFIIVLTVSRIRSHMATVAMQKDIRAIRELLVDQAKRNPIDPIHQMAVPTVTQNGDVNTAENTTL